jgi:general secretion pathway protein L
MQVSLVLKQWIEVLAKLLLSWQEARRERCSVVLSRHPGGFLIQHMDAKGELVRSMVSPSTPATKRIVSAARKGLVLMELPSKDVISRWMNIPAKARQFLPGIVSNQIDRLSPWQTDQAVYGFVAENSPQDPAVLNVRVMVSSRTIIDAARREISSIGLTLDRIIVNNGDGKSIGPIILWSRTTDEPLEGIKRVRRSILLGFALYVGLAVALTLWAIISAAAIRGQIDNVEVSLKGVQRHLQGIRSASTNAAQDSAERAWIAKQTLPSTLLLLETISKALPDTAYLTDLQFERTTVRMIGLAADVPSLISPLEQSGRLTEVHFSGPMTRGSDASRYRFQIEAHVEP